MMDLCAKLSAYSISTVRKHLRNLQEHVTPPIDGLFFYSSLSLVFTEIIYRFKGIDFYPMLIQRELDMKIFSY